MLSHTIYTLSHTIHMLSHSIHILSHSHLYTHIYTCCHTLYTHYTQAVTHYQFSSVQSLNMSDSLRPHESQHLRSPCPSPTPGVHSESHPSSQWCHPAISSSVVPFSSCLPPIPPSIRIFSNESTLRIRWPKYWSFSFSISPSNEHPGLTSFRMDWLVRIT